MNGAGLLFLLYALSRFRFLGVKKGRHMALFHAPAPYSTAFPYGQVLIYVLASILAPHLGQVMTIFPFPTGTRHTAPHLQVKYL